MGRARAVRRRGRACGHRPRPSRSRPPRLPAPSRRTPASARDARPPAAGLRREAGAWPPDGNVRSMSARAWTAFAAVSTLWGMPYPFIKRAGDDGVPPAFLAFVRVALGGAVLLALAWRAGSLRCLRGRWRWLAIYAMFEIAGPFPLIASGERHVASSLAAINIGEVPLFSG